MADAIVAAGPGPGAGRALKQDVTKLAGEEALKRLELLSEVSRALDSATDDYGEAAREVAALCVPSFADLCAIEVVGPDGQPQSVAYELDATSGLEAPEAWEPVGLRDAASGPVLVYEGNEVASAEAAKARRALGAASLLFAPITEGGITVGCFVAATGAARRAFRPSALKLATEVASRLASALTRTTLHREMKAASDEQQKAVRRLRRLATAAARLAGASTPREVLQVACLEARAIGEAEGANARWWMADGSVVEARSGHVDEHLAGAAFEAAGGRRFARGPGWVAYPLMPNQPRRRAALVVLAKRGLSPDEELVFASLASLVPIAFDRAVGTGTALAHEARVRAVLASSPVALVGLDERGDAVLANPAAQDLFGWGDGAQGIVLPTALRPAFAQLSAYVQQSGEAANMVVSAGRYELSLSAAPMPAIAGDDGDELSVLVAATDLSELKRAERALVQAQRLEAMGQVAGRVAHDFNNLLTVIIGYTEILNRNPSQETSQLAVTNIGRAARRATSLTQQLLSLSGKHGEGATAVDLAAELAEMRPVLERMAGERVTVQIELPGRPAVVGISPSGAEQLVLNLALNACQAMEERGSRLLVTLATLNGVDALRRARSISPRRPEKEVTGWAVMTVADDGPGMTEEVQQHCLEPFFTTKPKGQGTGLGLPTVYALVNDAGGHIEIESAPGTGTSIALFLPLSEREPLTADSTSPPAWPAGRVLSGRALLVEDQDELRALAAQALEEAGLHVAEAASAEGALELVAKAEAPFDILVSDVMLPGMGGPALAQAVGAGRASLPVLFVTAYPSEGAGKLPGNGPYSQVLFKPYRPEELVFAVAALLGSGPAEGGEAGAEGGRKPTEVAAD
jgi:signal transduction histidine kinase